MYTLNTLNKMEEQKCYRCKNCKSHNWHPMNAVDCCQDYSEEEKIKRKEYWKGKLCQHCGNIIGGASEEILEMIK